MLTSEKYKKLILSKGGERVREEINITSNIRKLIRCGGYKQSAIAERAGFEPKAFSALLNGRKMMRVSYIPPIAEALGVTANDLYKPSA